MIPQGLPQLQTQFLIPFSSFFQAVPAMGSGPIDPKELLKGLDCFLGRDGEVKTMDGISKIFRWDPQNAHF